MMKIEKQLANTDLDVYKQSAIDQFAKGICRYRLFKADSAMPNITHIGYASNSAWALFNALSRYLITGEKTNLTISKHLYDAVDKYKFTCSALTPTEGQKRVVKKSPRSAKRVFVDTSCLPNIEEVKKVEYPKVFDGECTTKFSYAVKLNHNTYKVFASEIEFNAFKEALELVGKPEEYKYVHLHIEEV